MSRDEHLQHLGMADSNAVGAAATQERGGSANPPSRLLAGDRVTARGTKRGQRYTRLQESTSSRTARALGDYVFAMARKRTGGE